MSEVLQGLGKAPWIIELEDTGQPSCEITLQVGSASVEISQGRSTDNIDAETEKAERRCQIIL
jgi:hypothetical protein